MQPATRARAPASPREAMDGFVAALRAKDIEAFLTLVRDDILLIGSEEGEVVHGRAELRALVERVLAAEATIGWDLSHAAVHERADVAWFAVETALEARHPSGVTRLPYRLSGVLVRDADGAWRWAQFHGSEPASPRAAPVPDAH